LQLQNSNPSISNPISFNILLAEISLLAAQSFAIPQNTNLFILNCFLYSLGYTSFFVDLNRNIDGFSLYQKGSGKFKI